MNKHVASPFFLVAVLALGGVGVAAPPVTPEDARFDTMLRAIDVVPPDRAALEEAFPDAWERLDRAAREAERDTWSRLRAVSLLSYFAGEPRTRSTLEAVATDRDREIRRQAVYTLGRSFGPSADAALVRFIEGYTADAEVAVAEHAVRALRWVDHQDAGRVLERLATRGPAHLKTLARTTIDKRTKRLRSVPRGD